MAFETKPAIRLIPDTRACFVCGPNNAVGLHVPFVPDGDHGSRAVYTALAEHCGWPGLLHGGVVFSLMDEALAYALHFQGLTGVTARVATRFRQPVPVGAKLVIQAWTLDRRRKLVDARAEIRLDSPDQPPEEQPLVAEADAKMYLQNNEIAENT